MIPDVITVDVSTPYDVVIGRGLLGSIAEMATGADRVAVIHPGALDATAQVVADDLRDNGFTVITIEVPEAEDAKTAEVASYCWTALGASGFTRTDVIVGIGGGATTDLAGFVAATWLRGVRVIQVPTTLLGMVDAAVGGKTGINTGEGKNLVGAFHSPAGVVCDLNALDTLPKNDFIAGLAEVIKIGFVADPIILDLIRQDPTQATQPDGESVPELIHRAVAVKAAVVAKDFTERIGQTLGREVLNYGHTFGHAVELVERYEWRHGAAVSVGMMYVAELARLGGKLDDAAVETHREVLESVGLPTSYRPGAWDSLYQAMARDKKARGSLLRFVILTAIGEPTLWEGPDPAILAAAYASISEGSGT